MSYEDNFMAFMDVTADVADNVEMTIVLAKPFATISVAGYVPKLAVDLSDPELDPVKTVSAYVDTATRVLSL